MARTTEAERAFGSVYEARGIQLKDESRKEMTKLRKIIRASLVS